MNPEIDFPLNHGTEPKTDDEMRPEYDFSGGVRGKYYQAYQQANNIIILEPDVVAAFPTSAAVNEALRMLMKIAATLPPQS
jgi:hypothetical protein